MQCGVVESCGAENNERIAVATHKQLVPSHNAIMPCTAKSYDSLLREISNL